MDKKILVTKEEERPKTTNAMSFSFGSFDPMEVLENQPTEEKKWEFKTIGKKDKKKKVCNIIEK